MDALLRDLGPQLRLGAAPQEASAHFAAKAGIETGISAIDELVGGGFPRGALHEISGPRSSGRTSLALALLAGTTRWGEVTAVVDLADAFDPASADRAGVDLDRVLWLRPPALREALRCAERLLEASGFALVLLDLTPSPQIAPATWPRLARAAKSSNTALTVLSSWRMAGTSAQIALELDPSRARFSGTPALLEGLETEVALVRSRSPGPRRVAFHLSTLAA